MEAAEEKNTSGLIHNLDFCENSISLFAEYLIKQDSPDELARALLLYPTVFLIPQGANARDFHPCFGIRFCVRIGKELRFTWDVVRHFKHFRKLRNDLLQCGFICKPLPCLDLSKDAPTNYVKRLDTWIQKLFASWQSPRGTNVFTSLSQINYAHGKGLLIKASLVASCFERFCFDRVLKHSESFHGTYVSSYNHSQQITAPCHLRDVIQKCKQQGFESKAGLDTEESGISGNIIKPLEVDVLVREAKKRLSTYASDENVAETIINSTEQHGEKWENRESKEVNNNYFLQRRRHSVTPRRWEGQSIKTKRRHSQIREKKQKANFALRTCYSFTLKGNEIRIPENPPIERPSLLPYVENAEEDHFTILPKRVDEKRLNRKAKSILKLVPFPSQLKRRHSTTSGVYRPSKICEFIGENNNHFLHIDNKASLTEDANCLSQRYQVDEYEYVSNASRKHRDRRESTTSSTFSCGGGNHLRFTRQQETIDEVDEDHFLFSSDESDESDYDYFSEGEFSDFSEGVEISEDMDNYGYTSQRPYARPIEHQSSRFSYLGNEKQLFNSLRHSNHFDSSLDNDDMSNILSQNIVYTCPLEEEQVVQGPSIGRVVAYEVLPGSHVNCDETILPYNYGALSLENFKPFRATVSCNDGAWVTFHERDCSSPISIPDDALHQLDFFTEMHEQTGSVLESVKSELDLAALAGEEENCK